MKKFVFISFLVFTSLACFSQNQNSKKVRKYELKISTFMLFGQFSVEYERIKDDYSSYGIAASYHEGYSSAHVFYRYYFNSKTDYGAKGFFMEGFAGLHTFSDLNEKDGRWEKKKAIAPGIGFALGKKWINKKGNLLQIHFGIGRDIKGFPMFQGGIYFGVRLKEIKKIF